MKDLKLWQKAGLVAAIVGGLTLGGLTPKYDSKGLESKIPSIGMSIAEAKETNPQGYQIPDLTGLTPQASKYKEDKGLTYKGEIFINVNGRNVVRLSRDGKIFGYIIDQNGDTEMDYSIVDNDGDGIFESKYCEENYDIPKWAV